MSILATLHKIEAEIVAYAQEAGKDIEQVMSEVEVEVKTIIQNKRIALANANAAQAQAPQGAA